MHARYPMIPALPFVLALLIGNAVLESAKGQDDPGKWPAGIQPKSELPDERAYDYDFEEVDVARLQWWLDAIRLRLPVRLQGKLTGWLWVQRSSEAWYKFGDYKVEASIRSPNLQIDQWLVSDAELRFGYAGGTWYVGKLTGVVKSPGRRQTVGTATLNAKVPTNTGSRIEFSARVAAVDLGELLESFGIENEIEHSDGQVRLSGTLPLASPTDLTTWDAQAELDLGSVQLPWIASPATATGKLKLGEGDWRLDPGMLGVAGQAIKLTGNGSLTADFPFEVTAGGEAIEIRTLLQELRVDDLARIASGEIRLDANVQGDRQVGLARARAQVDSASLQLDSATIENLSIRTNWSPEKVSLAIDSAALAGGTLTGDASWTDLMEIAAGLPSSAELNLKSIRLEQLPVPESLPPAVGRVSGQVTLGIVDEKPNKLLTSSGEVRIEQAGIAGTPLGDVQLRWTKDRTSQWEGVLSLKKESGAVTADVSVALPFSTGPEGPLLQFRGYRAEGKFDDYRVDIRPEGQDAAELTVTARGDFRLAGTAENLLNEGNLNLAGSTVNWLERSWKLEAAEAALDPMVFRLDHFRVVNPAGTFTGDAVIRREASGEHELRLKIEDLGLQRNLADLTGELIPEALKAVDGQAELELQLAKPAADVDWSSGWHGEFQGDLSELTYAKQAVGQLNVRGSLSERQLDATARGELLAGETTLSATVPLEKIGGQKTTGENRSTLRAEINGMQVRRLADLLLDPQQAQPWDGQASLQVTVRGIDSDSPTAEVKLEAPAIRKQRMTLARGLVAEIRYADGIVDVDRVSGGLADGRIDVRGQLGWNEGRLSLEDGRLNIATRQLDVDSLLKMLAPDYAGYYAGQLGFRGSLSYRRGFQLVGHAQVDNGKVFEIPLERARGRIHASFDESGQFRQLTGNRLHGESCGGSLDVKLKLTGGDRIGLVSSGKVTRARTDQLSEALGFEKIIGSGSFGGRFEIQSREITSLRALNGGVLVDFEKGNAQSIPLVSAIDRFVPLIPFASTEIESGFMNARFSVGQLRIGELQLTSRSFMIAANGNVALDGSRLDLEAIVFTGGDVQQRVVETALRELIVNSVPQIAAVARINDLLRNRTVFLHVRGTPSRPVVQPRLGETAIHAYLQNLARGLFIPSAQLLNGVNGN